MGCMDGPCRLHPSDHTKRPNSSREKKQRADRGAGMGVEQRWEPRQSPAATATTKTKRDRSNLHSPSAPGPARPSPADGSVRGAACRASWRRTRRRPCRLRHGGTAPRNCWGAQSSRGVSSAGPWRRPWCAVHGPGWLRPVSSLSAASFAGVVVVQQQQAWWRFGCCFCRWCCCWCRGWWGADVVVEASAGGRRPWASSGVVGAGWRAFPPGWSSTQEKKTVLAQPKSRNRGLAEKRLDVQLACAAPRGESSAPEVWA